MIKKILIFTLSFYFLVLIQNSFLVHFAIAAIFPNLILILVILINVFEDPQENSGILAALLGGFFLDIFSQRPFGFHILILFVLAIFLKFFLKKHLQPVIQLSRIYKKIWINILRERK